MFYNYICLGENLKKLRKSRNLSVSQLSELTGAPEGTLRSVEAGYRYFSLQRICHVANRCRISLDTLLVENADPSSVLREPRIPYNANTYNKLMDYIDDAPDEDIHFLWKIAEQLKMRDAKNGISGDIE